MFDDQAPSDSDSDGAEGPDREDGHSPLTTRHFRAALLTADPRLLEAMAASWLNSAVIVRRIWEYLVAGDPERARRLAGALVAQLRELHGEAEAASAARGGVH